MSTATETALPELTGSEKQIAWATDLRADRLAEIETVIRDLERGEELPKDLYFLKIADAKRVLRTAAARGRAEYWIDARGNNLAGFLKWEMLTSEYFDAVMAEEEDF